MQICVPLDYRKRTNPFTSVLLNTCVVELSKYYMDLEVSYGGELHELKVVENQERYFGGHIDTINQNLF